MDRRRFLLTSLIGALAAPPAVGAQQAGKVYRVGVLDPTPQGGNAENLGAFREGMRELGYAEGRNFVIEYRSPEGQVLRFRIRRGSSFD